MSLQINPGTTNVSVELQILDSGTWLPRTDFVYNSTGMDLNYRRDGAAVTSITEANLGALTTAHTDGGFLHVANGRYRLDLPDAACATGVNQVTVGGTVTGGVVIPRSIQLNVQEANVVQVSGDTTAAGNLKLQYNTTGLIGDTFPATQESLNNIANVGSAVSKPASSYTLTTGTQTVGTFAATAPLDGTPHIHTSTSGELDLYYEFRIGAGTPSSVTTHVYLQSSNDDLEVQAYDWVAAAWVQIGTLVGKNAATYETDSYDLFVDMVGSAGDEGKVRIRFTDGASTLTNATLAIDQIFCSFSKGAEGYDNGSVWMDTNYSNSGVEVGIDGVARNPAGSIADANTLLLATNLHRLEVAPGSVVTFAAAQTDEVHNGRDWTLDLGGQDITGSFIFGATVSGTGVATGPYEFEEACLNGVTLHNGGYFQAVSLADTMTIGQSGTFTFHNCFTRSGSAIIIDYASLGGTTLHMFDFHGEINFTNMAAGDSCHITGAGEITTTTCTGGIIDHDGFFEYTDSGGNVTEQQSDIKVAVDAVLVDTSASGVLLASTATSAQLVDDVWDEQITTSTHNVSQSAGKRLRQASASLVIESTVNSGVPTSTAFLTNLTSDVDDFYNDSTLTFLSGHLAGQSRVVTDYNGTTKAITFDEPLTSAPGGADEFQISADHSHSISQILTTQMTESYAADGVAPTMAQSLFLIQQSLGNFSIESGVLTVKQLDGSSTAATFALAPTGNPTSTTRSA